MDSRYERLKIDGEKLQKRFLLLKLRECYALYAEEFGSEIKFSKFCALRPAQILTYSETPLETCCCLIHENFINICNALSSKLNFEPYNTNWVNKWILCSPLTPDCLLLSCSFCANCPNNRILPPSEEQNEECIEVSYINWYKDKVTNRLQQGLIKQSLYTTYTEFMKMLPQFRIHHLIKRHQASVYRHQIDNIMDGELLIHFDFSQNYNCIHQEQVQSAYWRQSQITIFTVAVYGKDLKNMVAYLTDKNDHSKTCVSVFLELTLKVFFLNSSICLSFIYIFEGCKTFELYFLKAYATNSIIHKVTFWSDGPSSQFKNRFMVKFLKYCQVTFKIPTFEWNFFATAHGKGAIDGVGGTLKRIAWQKVKARQVIIQNAWQFYEAICKDSTVNLIYLTEDEIDQHYSQLSDTLLLAEKVEDIRLYHYWKVKNEIFSMQRISPLSDE